MTFSSPQVLVLLLFIFSLIVIAKIFISDYDNTLYYLRQYPYHMESMDIVILEIPSIDYRASKIIRPEINKGDFVYSPTLGLLVVHKVTENDITIKDIDLSNFYIGISGELILSLDYKYIVGFISRLDESGLIIVRTRF